MPSRLTFGLSVAALALAAALSCLPPAQAGPQVAEEAGLAISGTVMAPGTREPVPRARVLIASSGPGAGQTIVTTDAEGRFSLTGLEARLYRVSPIFPGTSDPPEVSPLRTRRVRLNPGEMPPGLELWLPQRVSVSGRILGAGCEPLPDFIVSLWRLGWNGRPTLVAAADSERARSDEEGRYELHAPPGEYYVDVTDASVPSSYQRHYYPGALYPEEAVPITLHAGVRLTGIDVSIRAARLYAVRFKVSVPHLPGVSESISGYLPDDARTIGAFLHPLGPGRIGMGRLTYVLPLRRIDGDVWVIRQRLGPGDFALSLVYSDALYAAFRERGFDPEGLHEFVRTRFTVNPDDADEAGMIDLGTIPVSPRVTVRGRVVVRASGAGPVDLTQLRLTHRPEVGADGTFLLRNRLPGRLTLDGLPQSMPEGWYVASIRSGGRDVLLDGLEVGGQTGPVEIVIAEGAGQIQGAARDADGGLVPDARVVLIPPSHKRGPQARFPTVVANTAGVYVLERIPPGEYRLLAMDEAGTVATEQVSPDLYWESPDFLRRYELRGEPITLDPGARLTINPDVIPLVE